MGSTTVLSLTRSLPRRSPEYGLVLWHKVVSETNTTRNFSRGNCVLELYTILEVLNCGDYINKMVRWVNACRLRRESWRTSNRQQWGGGVIMLVAGFPRLHDCVKRRHSVMRECDWIWNFKIVLSLRYRQYCKERGISVDIKKRFNLRSPCKCHRFEYADGI